MFYSLVDGYLQGLAINLAGNNPEKEFGFVQKSSLI